MNKRWMFLPLAALLLAGCTLGAAKEGLAGRIDETQRSLGTKLEVGLTHKLKSGEELAIFSYKKGESCGAGVVDMESLVSAEGQCSGPISPGQSGHDTLRIVYGYLPQNAGVEKIVLKWADGSEAEATIRKSTFYYLVEGEKVPKGEVTLIAYDKDGKVVQEAAPPAQHKH